MKTSWMLPVLAAGLAGLSGTWAQDSTNGTSESPDETLLREAATRKAIISAPLSVDLEDVPLQRVLEMLAVRVGAGLALDGHITSEALRQPLTLKLEDCSVYAVLHWVFRKRDLAWAIDGSEIVVAPVKFIDPAAGNRHLEFIERTDRQWQQETRPRLDAARMTLDVSAVPLVRVIDVVARHAELNVVWEDGAEAFKSRRVSFKASSTTVAGTLDKLTAEAGLSWFLEAEAVLISASSR